MADKSHIEWTDATWNPIVGCSIVSPGCTNCYAMKMAARIQKMNRTGGSGSNYVNHYDGTTQDSKAGAVWTGKVALARDKLFLKPLSWTKPRRIFVNSMGDLFHESIPDEWIDRVFAVMALCPQHTFQVLTKRAKRMRDYCSQLGLHHPFANVWLGVSCERQQEADERIPLLLETPAAIRFISAEPLLGPINIWQYLAIHHSNPHTPNSGHWLPRLDWVIVGGESGHDARPMNPQWVKDFRDRCSATRVAFFFKQWGNWDGSKAWAPGHTHVVWNDLDEEKYYFGDMPGFPPEHFAKLTSKKSAGRLLDGKEHNEFPQVSEVV